MKIVNKIIRIRNRKVVENTSKFLINFFKVKMPLRVIYVAYVTYLEIHILSNGTEILKPNSNRRSLSLASQDD